MYYTLYIYICYMNYYCVIYYIRYGLFIHMHTYLHLHLFYWHYLLNIFVLPPPDETLVLKCEVTHQLISGMARPRQRSRAPAATSSWRSTTAHTGRAWAARSTRPGRGCATAWAAGWPRGPGLPCRVRRCARESEATKRHAASINRNMFFFKVRRKIGRVKTLLFRHHHLWQGPLISTNRRRSIAHLTGTTQAFFLTLPCCQKLSQEFSTSFAVGFTSTTFFFAAAESWSKAKKGTTVLVLFLMPGFFQRRCIFAWGVKPICVCVHACVESPSLRKLKDPQGLFYIWRGFYSCSFAQRLPTFLVLHHFCHYGSIVHFDAFLSGLDSVK